MEATIGPGRSVVAHSSTKEGIRRAVMAGVEDIEHGDEADAETFALMKAHGVAFCPTLAAGYSNTTYAGWRPGVDAEPASIARKRASFRTALGAG